MNVSMRKILKCQFDIKEHSLSNVSMNLSLNSLAWDSNEIHSKRLEKLISKKENWKSGCMKVKMKLLCD